MLGVSAASQCTVCSIVLLSVHCMTCSVRAAIEQDEHSKRATTDLRIKKTQVRLFALAFASTARTHPLALTHVTALILSLCLSRSRSRSRTPFTQPHSHSTPSASSSSSA